MNFYSSDAHKLAEALTKASICKTKSGRALLDYSEEVIMLTKSELEVIDY
ncbi:MAG: hypothetical protein LBS61_00455 [Endomicrobium sp.]|jgi:hypothetical protein|nr:hypothetical protein [Endomicrobium sp.]